MQITWKVRNHPTSVAPKTERLHVAERNSLHYKTDIESTRWWENICDSLTNVAADGPQTMHFVLFSPPNKPTAFRHFSFGLHEIFTEQSLTTSTFSINFWHSQPHKYAIWRNLPKVALKNRTPLNRSAPNQNLGTMKTFHERPWHVLKPHRKRRCQLWKRPR